MQNKPLSIEKWGTLPNNESLKKIHILKTTINVYVLLIK